MAAEDGFVQVQARLAIAEEQISITVGWRVAIAGHLNRHHVRGRVELEDDLLDIVLIDRLPDLHLLCPAYHWNSKALTANQQPTGVRTACVRDPEEVVD